MAEFACDSRSVPPPSPVVYKRVRGIALRVFHFRSGHQTPPNSRPAVVFFHGGAWNAGTPAQFYPHCRHLASLGMVAISAEYRTFSRHRTSPFDAVCDARSAVRWVRAHAGQLGIDAKRIAAGGGSAGGHIALCAALLDAFDEEGEETSISCRPDALVLFNPVVDTGRQGFGSRQLRERSKQISPIQHVKPHDPARGNSTIRYNRCQATRPPDVQVAARSGTHWW